MAEMGVHISQSDDLPTQMTLGRAAAVYQFVRRETGEHDFGVKEIWVRFAFLGNKKMAELTENQLPWALGSPMLCKGGKTLELKTAIRAVVIAVKYRIVPEFARCIVAMR